MKVFGGNNHKNNRDDARSSYRSREEDLILDPSAARVSKNRLTGYEEQSFSDMEDNVKYSASTKYEDEDGNNTINAAARSRKKRRRKKGLTVFIVILAILALLVAAYSIWSRPPKVDDSGLAGNDASTPGTNGTVTSPDPDEDEEEPTTGRKDYCYTFLIVGNDQVSASTDTIIVGMMDTKNHTLNFIHIPRDTLVNVSWDVKRVNTILNFRQGIDGLIEGITDLIGYKIDAYAIVDIAAFELMVNAIGGVNYDVPIDMYYDAPDQSFHVAISKGYQWLSGEDALKVVRFRIGNDGTGYPDGDIGRINTQQSFLKSVMSQMLQLGNIPNLTKLIDIYVENVETNLSAANLAFFAEEFLKIDSEDMNFMTLPGNYNGSIKGGSYVFVDIPAWLEMVNAYLNPYFDEITEANVNLLTRDASGNFYSTTGTIEGGADSFLDYDAYIASLGQ